MDRLTSLRVFVEVAERGSFIAASESLGVSRPMTSKHVQELEAQLGVRLFNRTTRRISLTEAGNAFLSRCERILSELDDALIEAGQMQANPRGLLRINAPLTFGRAYLTPAIASFQEQYPDIAIDLALNDRAVDIVDEGYDLAIRVSNLGDSSLLARRLAPCRLVLCASADYLNCRGAPSHPRDLADHNCLIYEYFQREKQWTFTGDEGRIDVSVNGDFRSNFGEALVAAALNGRGIALEPSFTVSRYLQSGALISILPDFEPQHLGIYAVYPPSRMLPQKTRRFIDHLAEVFGPVPAWDV